MRNLTIRRTKSFVGCLATIKVYIEAPSAPEITINGIPCRKLGELKNGEEKTFLIDYFAAKVFVIADKLSKNYCNEFYQLPDGTEDIFLSGKNHLSIGGGNPFRFDNNTTEEVLANRARNTRKGLIITVACAIVGAVVGYFIATTLFASSGPTKGKKVEPETFTYENMSITLTNEFQSSEIEGFNAVFGTADVAIFVLKEDFDLMEGFEDYTVREYLDVVIEANALEETDEKTVDGRMYITYEATNPDNVTCRYYGFAFKTHDAFWLIQFATVVENVEEFEPKIMEWAKSVTFAE